MKIGILTFWKTEDNYGQLLQCYATQTFLRQLGHEPFLVKATNGHEYEPSLKQKLFGKLRTAYRLRKYPLYFSKRALGSIFYTLTHGKIRVNTPTRGFEEFRQKHLNCSKEYSLEELRQNPPKADAFFAGSDQIWNTTDGMYFLNWAPAKAKRIAIAASFGSRTPSSEFSQLIAPWLHRFDLVTVRETSGIEMCSLAGYEKATRIPDPTLLLDKEDYLKVASSEYPKSPYLFIYFLGTRTDINWAEIHKFARLRGLKVVYVGSQGQEDKYEKVEATIPEWLSLMAHADYVITNSFHGTVFAIHFQKRFAVYPIIGPAAKMNDRLYTLLTPLKLKDRIITSDLSILSTDINYTPINQQLKESAKEAKRILSDSLKS